MDGHAATKLIREYDPDVPIVGLTGNALDEQRLEFMTFGADEVLVKPLSSKKFDDVVLKYGVRTNKTNPNDMPGAPAIPRAPSEVPRPWSSEMSPIVEEQVPQA